MTISAYLEQLGFPHYRKGFICAEKAIQAYMDGYDGKISVLYHEISKQLDCHAERNIRYMITDAMDKNPDFFRILGLPEARWGTKFTNKEFLVHVAYRLKQMEATEANNDRP